MNSTTQARVKTSPCSLCSPGLGTAHNVGGGKRKGWIAGMLTCTAYWSEVTGHVSDTTGQWALIFERTQFPCVDYQRPTALRKMLRETSDVLRIMEQLPPAKGRINLAHPERAWRDCPIWISSFLAGSSPWAQHPCLGSSLVEAQRVTFPRASASSSSGLGQTGPQEN
jgi:hypothetical protein